MTTSQMDFQQLKNSLVLVGRWLLLSLILTSVTACVFDPEDPGEGGVVGTGLRSGDQDKGSVIATGIAPRDFILRGNVSERTQLASAWLSVRSQSGERSTVDINADGTFFAHALPGVEPWLLRSTIDEGVYQFGLGYSSVFSNVHGYMDVAVRAWFSDVYGISDVNAIFTGEELMPTLPTLSEFVLYSAPYEAAIFDILKDYNITAEELYRSDYRNSAADIDRFLLLNPVVIQGQSIDLVRTEPLTNTQSFYQGELLLGDCCDTVQARDFIPPTIPENLRAFGSSSGAVTLVWDAAEDNNAVSAYIISRDGKQINTTAHTTYTDETAQQDTVYQYDVVSLDIAGNSSVISAPLNISNTATFFGNVDAPSPPRELTAVVRTSRLAKLSWLQDGIESIKVFQVFRGPTIDELGPLVQVTSSDVIDVTVSASGEYCYAVSALNGKGVESSISDPVCLETNEVTVQ